MIQKRHGNTEDAVFRKTKILGEFCSGPPLWIVEKMFLDDRIRRAKEKGKEGRDLQFPDIRRRAYTAMGSSRKKKKA